MTFQCLIINVYSQLRQLAIDDSNGASLFSKVKKLFLPENVNSWFRTGVLTHEIFTLYIYLH